jgi:ACS family tartrate transporter-like MFS transporter
MYGFAFWLPKLLRQALPEFSDFHVSLLAILPWVLATASMWLIGQHSDRLRERRLHLVALFAWSLLQTQLLVQNPSGWGAVACLALIPMGIYGSLGIFWALATPMLKSAPAGGIALVNSVGNLGGFVAPFLFGALLDATGDARVSLLTMGGFLLLGLVVLLSLARASTEADA